MELTTVTDTLIEVKVNFNPKDLRTAQQKGLLITKKGRPVFFTKSAVRNRLKAFTVAFLDAIKGQPIESAPTLNGVDLCYFLEVDFAYTTKDKRKQGFFKTSRPDADNLLKGVIDAITDTGKAWKDDSSVMPSAKKYYTDGEPFIRIKIERAYRAEGIVL